MWLSVICCVCCRVGGVDGQFFDLVVVQIGVFFDEQDGQFLFGQQVVDVVVVDVGVDYDDILDLGSKVFYQQNLFIIKKLLVIVSCFYGWCKVVVSWLKGQCVCLFFFFNEVWVVV